MKAKKYIGSIFRTSSASIAHSRVAVPVEASAVAPLVHAACLFRDETVKERHISEESLLNVL